MNNFNLNPQQLAAVNDTEGAVLVIAGAGSGKTRVLTARVCHLIETGVDPYNILAITFTNKAANEMKERIERYIGSQSVWTSTFHSMCARMLRYDADRIGYSTDFTIYTDLESERVVKRVLQDYPQADPKNKGDYLNYIAEIGIIGGLAYFAWFFGSMGTALFSKKYLQSNVYEGILFGLGLALISVALNGLTDDVLFNIPSSMLLWMICGLICVIDEKL